MEILKIYTKIFTALKTPKNTVRKSNEAGKFLNMMKYKKFQFISCFKNIDGDLRTRLRGGVTALFRVSVHAQRSVGALVGRV